MRRFLNSSISSTLDAKEQYLSSSTVFSEEGAVPVLSTTSKDFINTEGVRPLSKLSTVAILQLEAQIT